MMMKYSCQRFAGWLEPMDSRANVVARMLHDLTSFMLNLKLTYLNIQDGYFNDQITCSTPNCIIYRLKIRTTSVLEVTGIHK